MSIDAAVKLELQMLLKTHMLLKKTDLKWVRLKQVLKMRSFLNKSLLIYLYSMRSLLIDGVKGYHFDSAAA